MLGLRHLKRLLQTQALPHGISVPPPQSHQIKSHLIRRSTPRKLLTSPATSILSSINQVHKSRSETTTSISRPLESTLPLLIRTTTRTSLSPKSMSRWTNTLPMHQIISQVPMSATKLYRATMSEMSLSKDFTLASRRTELSRVPKRLKSTEQKNLK